MSRSPNAALVQRTIDLNYDNKRRASSLKWFAVNGVVVAVLAYDLWWSCPGHTTALHYVEALAAVLAAAALLQHAWRLAPSRRAPLALSATQRRLLGLAHQHLDSSFNLVEEEAGAGRAARGVGLAPGSDSDSALSVSLSPRAWRAAAGAGEDALRGGGSPPSPGAAGAAGAPLGLGAGRAARDEFISDSAQLAAYLRACDALADREPAPPPLQLPLPLHPPPYLLAETNTESGQGSGQGQGPGQGKPEEARSPQVWRRLQLDPRRLTQWNLNLRLWIHVTILERLVREMETVDAALAALGLGELRLGHASLERLAKLAPAVPALSQLLPFLELAPDQSYLVGRIRELARGGCLSEYRWCGGGAAWEDAKPTDAEVVLHLFATYLDGQVPGGGCGGARPFSAAHVTAAPQPPGALGLHRARRRPPHYVLALADDTLEVCSGRANLLHTLLLFLAAAARSDPPALLRLHLGPAGLNVLWIIGR